AFTFVDGRLLKILRATPLGDAGAHGRRAGGSISEEEIDSAGSDASRAGEAGTLRVEGGVPVVTTGAGRLRLDEVQLEGKRAMPGAEFARGYPRLNTTKLA